jgi:hypothetical protein
VRERTRDRLGTAIGRCAGLGVVAFFHCDEASSASEQWQGGFWLAAGTRLSVGHNSFAFPGFAAKLGL